MPKNTKKKYIGIVGGAIVASLFLFYMLSPVPEIDLEVTTPIADTGQASNIEATAISPLPYNEKKTATASKTPARSAEEKPEQKLTENKESFTLIAGDTRVNLSFAPNTIFYDALIQARDAGKITFSGKNYPGLGFFVTDIGTLQAGSRKYLIYYINGKEATVGVSAYTLKDGDILEWKLE